MNISIGDTQAAYTDGVLTLKYMYVTFDIGTWPNSINGNIQVTPEDGISLASTEEEVKEVAKAKMKTLLADLL